MKWYFSYDFVICKILDFDESIKFHLIREIVTELGAINIHPVKFNNSYQYLKYAENVDRGFDTGVIFQAGEGFDVFLRIKYDEIKIEPIATEIAELVIKGEIVDLRKHSNDFLNRLMSGL